jgi:hypothetical protein
MQLHVYGTNQIEVHLVEKIASLALLVYFTPKLVI